MDDVVAVRARGLTRRFGDVLAVDRLDLEVRRGAFHAVLGPNGAGKTTTIRMCTGLLRPSDGVVEVFGRSVWGDLDAAKAAIGVLPEEAHLFDRLTGKQLLEFHGLLRGLPAALVHERADELLEVFDLDGARDEMVVDYSHGMRKKVGLAAALIHNPRLLFLDEPFEAIDPVSAKAVRGVLRRYTEAGGTIVFSSHVLQVVEQVCTHVSIVHEGRVVRDAPMEEIRRAGGLEDVFTEAVGAVANDGTELGWLGSSSA